MTMIDNIVSALQLALPKSLHIHIAQLAPVLADMISGVLLPEVAQKRLQDPTIIPILKALAGKDVSVGTILMSFSPKGHSISVGDISQAKGVAIGTGAVSIADMTIHIGQHIVSEPASIRTPFMAQPLPDDFVPRDEEFGLIIAYLLDESGNARTGATVALIGPGGYGKTTLARGVCQDERILKAFGDGILWTTLGESADDAVVIERLADVIEILTNKRPAFTGIDAATTRSVEVLQDKTLLLVIDDVWNAAHLAPFLIGGVQCSRLITTRNVNVLPAPSPYVRINAMRQDEAVTLLSARLPANSVYAQALRKLAKRLDYWPLLLRLVNSAMREQIRQGMTMAGAIDYINEGLDEEGPVAFDETETQARDRAVSRTLKASLSFLSQAEQSRFNELAVFPEGVDIPLVTLIRYWAKTSQLSSFAVKHLCSKLYRLSLVLALDHATQALRLHTLVTMYLHRTQATNLEMLHNMLLDAYLPAGSDWRELPEDDRYIWNYLAYHLAGSGRVHELERWASNLYLEPPPDMSAKLSEYEVKYLAHHLAAAGRINDLVRLTKYLRLHTPERTSWSGSEQRHHTENDA